MSGQSDFGTSFATHSKYSWLTFSDPVFDTQMVYLTNSRKPVNNYANALSPFKWNVWCGVIGTLILTTVVLTFMMKSYNALYDYGRKER